MRRLAFLALLAASLFPSARAGAQLSTALELSSGLARSTPATMEPGVGLSPSVGLRHGLFDSWAGGTLTGFGRGGLAADVEGYASLTAPEWRCLRLSTTLAGEAHEYAGGGRARRAELGARVGCTLSHGFEGWAGASAASGQAPGAVPRPSARLELGAALGEAARGVTISVRSVSLPGLPAVFRDTTVRVRTATQLLFETRRILVREAVPENHHVDVAGRATWTRGFLGAEFDFGARVGERAGARERWASAALSYRVFPGVTIGAGYGVTPSEPEGGLHRGRRLMVALRVTPEERRPVVPLPSPLTSAPRLHLRVVPVAPGLQALRLQAPAARSVEVAGDFSDWTPIPLERVGDDWETRLHLEPGVYRLNLRLDGGPWLAPPGLPAERDGFGGEVGVLAVPAPAPDR